MRHRNVTVAAGVAAAMLSTALPAAARTAGAPPRVTTTADAVPGSLRAALQAMSGARGAVVDVPAGTYRLTRCGADDSGSAGDLDLRGAGVVTIRARGGGATLVQTCPGERVLDVRGGGRLVLDGITVTGGSVAGAPGEVAEGGGVRSAGDVVLTRSTVRGNTARGGDAAGPGSDGGSAAGGGLWVGGSLTAVRSRVESNSAVGGAGAQLVAGDAASGGGDGSGGGVHVVGAATVTGLVTSANRAVGGTASPPTGSPSCEVPAASAGSATGGAIRAGGRVVAVAVSGTGDSAVGGSAPTTDFSCASAGAARGGAIAGAASVSVSGSSFTGARAVAGDAFWRTFSMAGVPVGTSQSPAEGGALAASGTLTLVASRITGSAAVSGQGIPGVDAAAGGAVFGAGAVSAVSSVLSGNTAGRGRADILGGRGGAVAGGDVRLRAAQLSGNTAGGDGGAVSAASLEASRSSLAGNVGGHRGGAAAVTGNTSVADSTVRQNVLDGRFLSCVCGADVAAAGAGLHAGGSMSLLRTQVSGNTGEVRFQVGNLAAGSALARGGGVDAAALTARDSTIAGNSLTGTEYAEATGWTDRAAGGGLAAGAATLTNTTVTGNTVRNAIRPDAPQNVARGAAVSSGSLRLEHATMTANLLYRFDFTSGTFQPATGPAAATLTAAPLEFRRSVVLPATDQVTCGTGTTAAASAYSVAGDASCGLAGPGDRQSGAGVRLGPLGGNGGPVPTQLPGTGSVLVDPVPLTECPVRADARGVRRPQGPRCDIGAVEVVHQIPPS